MERGTPKEDTGIEGLSAIEYKEKMATAHVRQLKKEQADIERRKAELEQEKAAREKEVAELEKQRKEKQKALDAESGSAVKSGIANLFGKGKYAEIEKQNTQLRSRIETANTEREWAMEQVTQMEAQVAEIPKLAEQKALTIIAKKEEQHIQEVQLIKKQNDDRLFSFQSKYEALTKEYRALEKSSGDRIERLENEKADLMARIQAMLDLLMDALKEAVRVVIEFSRSVFKEFTKRHRETLAEYLVTTDNPAKAVNEIKAFTRPFLNDRQFEKGSRELDRFVSNFPAVLEDMNRNRSRGFKR